MDSLFEKQNNRSVVLTVEKKTAETGKFLKNDTPVSLQEKCFDLSSIRMPFLSRILRFFPAVN